MLLTAVGKQKRFWEKLKAKAAYKVKKLERQDKRYINKEMVLKADTERQLRCRLQKAVKYGVSELSNQPIVITSTPYNVPSTLGRTVKKAERALLLSPPQRATLIKQVAVNSIIALENSLCT